MIDAIAETVFNFWTPITIVVALLAPSLWLSAAAAVSVAMIGVIALGHGQPGSQIVAAWLIGQVATALAVNFISRKARQGSIQERAPTSLACSFRT